MMTTTRLSHPPTARLFLLLTLALLQAAALAVQPALREYNARMRTFQAQIPAVTRSAEQAAETMLAHPEALLNVPYDEQMGFAEELLNRAGGLAHVSPSGGWGRTPTPNDVVLLSVRSWEGQSPLIRRRVKEYKAEGWTVTVIGSKVGRPRDLGADFFIDNGAPSGAAKHGRINVLANVTLGWMWCCEYAAAMSRKGRFPAILQSICMPGADEYDRSIQSAEGRRSTVECDTPINPGELSQLYLLRIGLLAKNLASERIQLQLGLAAEVIAGRLAKGGRVGMVGMGHVVLEEVKVENKTPWVGFRAVGNSNVAIKAYLRPGDLLVWMSYNGMNSVYEDYAKSISDAKVDLISCYAPDPIWSKDPPPTLAHIDQNWKLPDAEVPIPVFPYYIAPVSGINVTLLLRMLDDETAERLRKQRVTPRVEPVTLPPEFVENIAEQIYERGDNETSLSARRAWEIIDGTGKAISPARYDEVGTMEMERAPVRRGSKWGYIDMTGAEVVVPAFQSAEAFFGETARVGIDGKFGLIDRTGKVALPLEYDEISTAFRMRTTPALYLARREGKWGVVDTAGKVLLPPRYDGLSIFSNDKVTVRVGNKYGLIAVDGTEVIPPRYESIRGYGDGYGSVRLNRKYGVIDPDGREIVPPKYDRITGFGGGAFIVQSNSRWGIVNREGVELIPPKYDDLESYDGDLIRVKADGQWGAIDINTGEEAIAPRYEEMQRPGEGAVAVRLNGKWGFVDLDGKEIVPAVYDEASPFRGGSAAVTRGGKRLFIDKTGAETPAREYDYFADGGDGFIRVVRDNRWGFIDTAGKEIVPPKYTFALGFERGNAPVYAGGAWATPVGRTPVLRGGKWGLIDSTGKELVPPQYDRIVPIGNGFYAAGTDLEVVPPQP